MVINQRLVDGASYYFLSVFRWFIGMITSKYINTQCRKISNTSVQTKIQDCIS